MNQQADDEAAFRLAVIEHARCLECYGEADPRTEQAAQLCLLLMPEEMFSDLLAIGKGVH
jgi:hypothetical protein